MIKLRIDVYLVILTLLVGSFAALIINVINRIDWNEGIMLLEAIMFLVLGFLIWLMLKGLLIMHEKEDDLRKEENKQLVNNTVEKTLKDLGLKK